jgi:oxalate decarboxylase/phosphoglucose isomerase-like protein (cupin superfamily)
MPSRHRRLIAGKDDCASSCKAVGLYVPFVMGHYIQNIGKTPLLLFEMFASDRYEDVSLKQWMALTPPELVKQHLHLGSKAKSALKARQAACCEVGERV